jgi:uncharacterized protein (TIGR00106 family)
MPEAQLISICIKRRHEMNTLVEFSIFPMDKGESVSPYVARCIKIIEESGLDFETGSMGTCIEGEWDAVMETVSKCMKSLERDCSRIYMTMKADARRNRKEALKGKVDSVRRRLGR